VALGSVKLAMSSAQTNPPKRKPRRRWPQFSLRTMLLDDLPYLMAIHLRGVHVTESTDALPMTPVLE
jgi:hypothetical protein